MQKYIRVFVFILQFIIAGLALAFVATYLLPQVFRNEPLNSKPIPAGPASYAKAVKLATPAVVNIYSRRLVTEQPYRIFADPTFQRFSGISLGPARQRLSRSDGSGVLISANGFLLTNFHVVRGADQILVGLSDGRVTPAKIIGVDAETDLAVLKIEGINLPIIKPQPANKLDVGDVVLAIGNPLGVGQTVTMGIVSATGRSQSALSRFEDFIQTDAAINLGNSGGALINAAGELVGINTAVLGQDRGAQGISFAIPADVAMSVMEEIKTQGRVIRGWIGIEYTDAITDPNTGKRGVEVISILPNGPAELAGLQVGDLITRFGDKEVLDAQNLRGLEASIKPGRAMQIEVDRAGLEFHLNVSVIERPNVSLGTPGAAISPG